MTKKLKKLRVLGMQRRREKENKGEGLEEKVGERKTMLFIAEKREKGGVEMWEWRTQGSLFRESGPVSCSSYLQRETHWGNHCLATSLSLYHLPGSDLSRILSSRRGPSEAKGSTFPWQWNPRLREQPRSRQSLRTAMAGQATSKAQAGRGSHWDSRPGTD